MNDDLIIREALKKAIIEWFHLNDVHDQYWWNRVKTIIDNAPTVERPTGEWIEDDYAGIHCSECSYIPLKDVVIKIHSDGTKERGGNYNLTPYCPICGAYMKGKEKKNEFSPY